TKYVGSRSRDDSKKNGETVEMRGRGKSIHQQEIDSADGDGGRGDGGRGRGRG
ncbi:hypothetical protein PIB30_090356, partial [Stylosanthes scabra]|nr:hypothetical protein [Stylosanthes scabra]